MTAACIAFAAGVLALQLQPVLPGLGWVGLVAVFPVFFFRRKIVCLPAAFAVGFCWALGMAQLKLTDRLAPGLEGPATDVARIVASLPAAGERSLRFEF